MPLPAISVPWIDAEDAAAARAVLWRHGAVCDADDDGDDDVDDNDDDGDNDDNDGNDGDARRDGGKSTERQAEQFAAASVSSGDSGDDDGAGDEMPGGEDARDVAQAGGPLSPQVSASASTPRRLPPQPQPDHHDDLADSDSDASDVRRASLSCDMSGNGALDADWETLAPLALDRCHSSRWIRKARRNRDHLDPAMPFPCCGHADVGGDRPAPAPSTRAATTGVLAHQHSAHPPLSPMPLQRSHFSTPGGGGNNSNSNSIGNNTGNSVDISNSINSSSDSKNCGSAAHGSADDARPAAQQPLRARYRLLESESWVPIVGWVSPVPGLAGAPNGRWTDLSGRVAHRFFLEHLPGSTRPGAAALGPGTAQGSGSAGHAQRAAHVGPAEPAAGAATDARGSSPWRWEAPWQAAPWLYGRSFQSLGPRAAHSGNVTDVVRRRAWTRYAVFSA
jgi:hypothetical protein